MNKNLIIAISILFIIIVGYLYTHDKVQPTVFDPDVSYSNPVPSVTGEVDCESGKITWYIKNMYDENLLLTDIALNHKSISQPRVDLFSGNTYELDTVIPEELKGQEEFVYLTVYGNYRLLTEPYQFYKIEVQNNGSVSVKDCK